MQEYPFRMHFKLCPWLARILRTPEEFNAIVIGETPKAYHAQVGVYTCWIAKSKVINSYVLLD